MSDHSKETKVIQPGFNPDLKLTQSGSGNNCAFHTFATVFKKALLSGRLDHVLHTEPYEELRKSFAQYYEIEKESKLTWDHLKSFFAKLENPYDVQLAFGDLFRKFLSESLKNKEKYSEYISSLTERFPLLKFSNEPADDLLKSVLEGQDDTNEQKKHFCEQGGYEEYLQLLENRNAFISAEELRMLASMFGFHAEIYDPNKGAYGVEHSNLNPIINFKVYNSGAHWEPQAETEEEFKEYKEKLEKPRLTVTGKDLLSDILEKKPSLYEFVAGKQQTLVKLEEDSTNVEEDLIKLGYSIDIAKYLAGKFTTTKAALNELMSSPDRTYEIDRELKIQTLKETLQNNTYDVAIKDAMHTYDDIRKNKNELLNSLEEPFLMDEIQGDKPFLLASNEIFDAAFKASVYLKVALNITVIAFMQKTNEKNCLDYFKEMSDEQDPIIRKQKEDYVWQTYQTIFEYLNEENQKKLHEETNDYMRFFELKKSCGLLESQKQSKKVPGNERNSHLSEEDKQHEKDLQAAIQASLLDENHKTENINLQTPEKKARENMREEQATLFTALHSKKQKEANKIAAEKKSETKIALTQSGHKDIINTIFNRIASSIEVYNKTSTYTNVNKTSETELAFIDKKENTKVFATLTATDESIETKFTNAADQIEIIKEIANYTIEEAYKGKDDSKQLIAYPSIDKTHTGELSKEEKTQLKGIFSVLLEKKLPEVSINNFDDSDIQQIKDFLPDEYKNINIDEYLNKEAKILNLEKIRNYNPSNKLSM